MWLVGLSLSLERALADCKGSPKCRSLAISQVFPGSRWQLLANVTGSFALTDLALVGWQY